MNYQQIPRCLFYTSYKLPNGGTSVTQCYARDAEHLETTMAMRGMGEKRYEDHFVVPTRPEMPSELLDSGQYNKAIHALTWACMIGSSAGILTAWEMLNDNGILHEMAHLVEVAGYRHPSPITLMQYKTSIRPKLLALERRIPGLAPSWAMPIDLEKNKKVELTISVNSTPAVDTLTRAQMLMKMFMDMEASVKDSRVSMSEFTAAVADMLPEKAAKTTHNFADKTAMTATQQREEARRKNIENFKKAKKPEKIASADSNMFVLDDTHFDTDVVAIKKIASRVRYVKEPIYFGEAVPYTVADEMQAVDRIRRLYGPPAMKLIDQKIIESMMGKSAVGATSIAAIS